MTKSTFFLFLNHYHFRNKSLNDVFDETKVGKELNKHYIKQMNILMTILSLFLNSDLPM